MTIFIPKFHSKLANVLVEFLFLENLKAPNPNQLLSCAKNRSLIALMSFYSQKYLIVKYVKRLYRSFNSVCFELTTFLVFLF